jgi:hypothetical protein
MLFADVVHDEDNAIFIGESGDPFDSHANALYLLTDARAPPARVGAHPVLLRLMEHESELIQDVRTHPKTRLSLLTELLILNPPGRRPDRRQLHVVYCDSRGHLLPAPVQKSHPHSR